MAQGFGVIERLQDFLLLLLCECARYTHTHTHTHIRFFTNNPPKELSNLIVVFRPKSKKELRKAVVTCTKEDDIESDISH